MRMGQDTRVFVLAPEAWRAWRAHLEARLPADAEWRPVPYARFSVKADGTVLTFYQSGKVVLQGAGLDGFVQRYLDGLERDDAAAAEEPGLSFDAPTAGSDETGKGDYFGPLVVAAVFAAPTEHDTLRGLGVADSKTLSDARCLRIAEHLERGFATRVVSLPPQEYNRRITAAGNVNRLLAALHAEALGGLLAAHPEIRTVVVDRFADDHVILTAFRAAGLAIGGTGGPAFVHTPRGERHPVVAAASIVARAHFLEGLKRCEEDSGCELHKGAGAPVDAAGRKVLAVGGMDLLARVAKLHFANTRKIRGGS